MESTGDMAVPELATTPARLRLLPSRLLGLASAQAGQLVGEGLAGVGAHRWHYGVLAALAEFGAASQAELSDRTGVYRSDMVAVLNALAEQGFVERTPDPADRRRNVVTLTGLGAERLRSLDALIAALQDELLAPLSPGERTQLVHLLTRLIDYHAGARE